MITKKFLNFITLIPNSRDLIIDSNSTEGWYVLYAPDNNLENASSSVPIPIYIKNTQIIDPQYLGYTTKKPISCLSAPNFLVGFCDLIYQNLEDSLSSQRNISSFGNSGTVDKSLNEVVGRILFPENSFPIDDNAEYYCIYNRDTNCPKFKLINNIPEFQAKPENLINWKLGFITYSDIHGGTYITQKAFGKPVEGTFRYIGKLQNYLNSHVSLQQVESSDPTQLPMFITNFYNLLNAKWDAGSQLLIIENNYENFIILTGNYTGTIDFITDPIIQYLPNQINISNSVIGNPVTPLVIDFRFFNPDNLPNQMKLICGNQSYEWVM